MFAGKYKDLQKIISECKALKQSMKSYTAAQTDKEKCFHKWGQSEESSCFQDLGNKVVELNRAWTEAQVEFQQDIKTNRLFFEDIIKQEKSLDSARAHTKKMIDKEQKAHAELQKKLKKGEDSASAEQALRNATSVREMAEADAEDTHLDVEKHKHRIVKESMKQMADSYIALSNKCILIFQAHKELADLIPEEPPNLQEVDTWAQKGPDTSAWIVMEAKENLRNMPSIIDANATVGQSEVSENSEPEPPRSNFPGGIPPVYENSRPGLDDDSDDDDGLACAQPPSYTNEAPAAPRPQKGDDGMDEAAAWMAMS